MKSQRRHELHHNVLADWLGKKLEVVKPYTNVILGCVIALCAVAIVVQIVSWRNSSSSIDSWQRFYTALAVSNPDERVEELNKLTDTPAALWAHLTAGDLELDQATAKIYSDREKAKESLEAAKKHYAKAEEAARRHPLLQQRAQIGLAQAHETWGDFDEAKKAYRQLIKGAPDSVFSKAASLRLKRLDNMNVKEFYEQLAAHKPSNKTPPPGLDRMQGFPGLGGPGGLGGLGGMAGFGEPLPERPDLSLPGPGGLEFPPLDPPDASAPKTEEDKPADPEKKPADKPEGDGNPEP